MSEPAITEEQDCHSQQTGGWEYRIAAIASALVLGIARHWLALFNMAWGMYVILPMLAPMFMQLGLILPARAIYGLYSFLCHQIPDHSYFLFGPIFAPQGPELEAAGMAAGGNLLLQRKFIGNSEIGYKVALCQRDLAIYSSVFVSGIVYSFIRGRIKPLSFKLYILFVLPMAIDGITQMVGLRMSNWWLRGITGALFGAASIWLAYPYVDDAMQDVIETEEKRIEEVDTTPNSLRE